MVSGPGEVRGGSKVPGRQWSLKRMSTPTSQHVLLKRLCIRSQTRPRHSTLCALLCSVSLKIPPQIHCSTDPREAARATELAERFFTFSIILILDCPSRSLIPLILSYHVFLRFWLWL